MKKEEIATLVKYRLEQAQITLCGCPVSIGWKP